LSIFTYQGSARLTVDFGDLALPLGTKRNYTDLQQLSFDDAGEEAAGLGAPLKARQNRT
jgi:hypothetical protein